MYSGGAGRLMMLSFPILIVCITSGLCASCSDGCAGGCKEANCTSCIPGRWGNSCEESCLSHNCLNNECHRRYGHCERGCSPGFAFVLQRCLDKCPQTCRTCENNPSAANLLCTSCNEGYTGYPHCQYTCLGCIATLCNATEGSGQCTLGCMEGYFTNSDMNYSKRIIIFRITPVVEISICKKCKDNCSSCLSLEYCTSCIPGTYGQSCEHPCDPNCRKTACISTTGVCENDCSSGYYTNGTTCESCPTCDDCKTDPCKSSCCQATTSSICSVKNCDACSEIDLDLCKDCLDGYRVTGNGTCESNSGLLTSGSLKGDDDDIVIGFAIGSPICLLLLVAVLVVAMFIMKRKRLRQESRNQTETGDNDNDYLNDAVCGSSRNTDENSRKIGGNSGTIYGESRSEIRTTLTNNDRHENDYVDNPDTGRGTTDYEALRLVSRDEHVYGIPEEPASISTFVTGRDTTVYETLNSGSKDEHVYGVPEEPILNSGSTDEHMYEVPDEPAYSN